MRRVRTVPELREALAGARRDGARIGLVPTMGAFHDGHLELMRRARAACDVVVVSLFVNPTQFGEAADLDAYPRDEERDAVLAEAEGVNVLFAPPVSEVYPQGFATLVRLRGPLTETLEGAVRGPEHFDGVATVVTKLLNMAQPDVAFFGAKDSQQVRVVRRLVRDLDIPVEIRSVPTVREAGGLARSSRNARLTAAQRERALALPRALAVADDRIAAGERDTAAIVAAARAVFAAHGVEPDYVAVVAPGDLAPVAAIDAPVLVAVAARIGSTRLIDSRTVAPPAPASHEPPVSHEPPASQQHPVPRDAATREGADLAQTRSA